MKRNCLALGVIALLISAVGCMSTQAGKHSLKKERSCTTLPAPVKTAIDNLYPQAQIEKVKWDKESVKVYEIEIEQDGQEYELTVTPDGTIIEKEEEIAIDSLPVAIKNQLSGAKIEEATQETTYWIVTLQKLDNPKVTYTVELKQNGKKMEMELADDGTILEKETRHEGKSHHGEERD